MKRAVKCGVFDAGNGFEIVGALSDTGDLIVDENLMGTIYLNPVQVPNPMYFESDEAAIGICEALGCQGVVLASDALITFRGDVAEFREITNTDRIIKTVEFDTDLTCEEPVAWQ